MPPRVRFQKEDIAKAALDIARESGIGAVTAREVAKRLKMSVGPIFTCYDSMEQLKRDVFEAAKNIHRERLKQGLKEKIPFLGVGMQYIAFAKEEPQLYRLLFLTKPDGAVGSAAESLKMAQELVRESLMRIYNIDAFKADCYFRDLWLVVLSFSTLIVTGDCPYTDEEISAVLAEVSLSVCKAYKEIPGLPEGNYDKDAVFRELVKK